MAYLRLAVRGDDEQAVGRAFSGAVVETSLSSYPGTFFTSAPSGAQGVARYWPTTVSAAAVAPRVCVGGVDMTPTSRPTSTGPEAADRAVAAGARTRAPRRGRTRREKGHRPAPRPGRRSLGRQGRRRQRRAVGRRGGRLALAVPRLHDRAVPGVAARDRHPRGAATSAAQPARRQLRRPRLARLGRGVQPPARHPGQGTGRVAALARRRGASVSRRLRPAGCPLGGVPSRRRIAAGIGSGHRPRRRPGRRHRARARQPVERVLGSGRAPRHLGPGAAGAGPGHRRLGAHGGPPAPHLRGARPCPVVRRPGRPGFALRPVARPGAPGLLLHHLVGRGDRLRLRARHRRVLGVYPGHRHGERRRGPGARDPGGGRRPARPRPRDRVPPRPVQRVRHAARRR